MKPLFNATQLKKQRKENKLRLAIRAQYLKDIKNPQSALRIAVRIVPDTSLFEV
jgi:hypothetical protein